MSLDTKPIVSYDELMNSGQHVVPNNFFSDNFIPRSTDVIIGRGKKANSHVGNRKLHRIMVSQLANYSAAKNKDKKSEIISFIVGQIKLTNPSGAFVKEDKRSGMWFDVGGFTAREKISRMFRNLLHIKYKSSSMNRKYCRKKANARVPDLWKTEKDYSLASYWFHSMERENIFKPSLKSGTKEIENNGPTNDFGEASSDALDELEERQVNMQGLFPEKYLSNTVNRNNCQGKEHEIRYSHIKQRPKDAKEEKPRFDGGEFRALDQTAFDEMDQLEELDVTELAYSNKFLDLNLFFSNPFSL